jgi:hypothetical protein
MRFISIALFLIIATSGYSQFGLRVMYNRNSAPGWDSFFTTVEGTNTTIFDQSLTVVGDYWIRLPNKRIEFYPNLSFHQASTVLTNSNNTLKLRQIGVGLITHFYILDLIGDCDCPTFSKQGQLVKKGLFLMAGAGVDYSQKSILNDYTDANLDFKISGGIGLDIGISDLITLTPFIQYQYYPDISWHELSGATLQNVDNINSSLGQFQIGIRVGFRPDYK